MYFTNIANEELHQFHNQIRINFRILLKDIVDGFLFKKENLGSIIKVYPLFYCDRIESNNPNDRIFENKCILCENDEDTILYFVSDENIPVTNVSYSHYTDSEDYLVFYVYNAENSNTLHNVIANVIFKKENEVINELELYSNRNGIIYIDTTKTDYDEINITFKVNGASTTFNLEK